LNTLLSVAAAAEVVAAEVEAVVAVSLLVHLML
jgi:hypothetical protein